MRTVAEIKAELDAAILAERLSAKETHLKQCREALSGKYFWIRYEGSVTLGRNEGWVMTGIRRYHEFTIDAYHSNHSAEGEVRICFKSATILLHRPRSTVFKDYVGCFANFPKIEYSETSDRTTHGLAGINMKGHIKEATKEDFHRLLNRLHSYVDESYALFNGEVPVPSDLAETGRLITVGKL